MAITTNHTIDTTLRKAIDYILNPDKTQSCLFTHTPVLLKLQILNLIAQENTHIIRENISRVISYRHFRRVKPHPNRLTKSESVSLMNCWAVNLNTF